MSIDNTTKNAELNTQIQYKLIEQLSTSAKRYKDLLDRLSQIVFECDEDGVITYLNPAWETKLGYTIDCALGKHLADYVFEDDNEIITDTLKASSAELVELRLLSNTNQALWFEMTIHNEPDNLKQGFLHDITQRKSDENEIKQFNKLLEDRVHERTSDLKLANQDLADSLKKLQQTQEQLVQAEKLASLGGLVAGIAHEINTPLGVGLTASTFLVDLIDKIQHQVEQPSDSLINLLDKSKRSANIIVTNLERATQLVNSFKQIAVDQTSDNCTSFNLNNCINNVIKSLEPSYKRNQHSIKINCPSELVIYGYPGAIFQILTNLITNSLAHGFKERKNGQMTISVIPYDKFFLLRYSDNGAGIARDHLDRIFDPFFTTARGAGGTGLGMHITYNIAVHKLGGSISCLSKQNEGVLFDITLPITIKTKSATNL